MPERHYPSFELDDTPKVTAQIIKAFQCQNGIIPRSNFNQYRRKYRIAVSY